MYILYTVGVCIFTEGRAGVMAAQEGGDVPPPTQAKDSIIPQKLPKQLFRRPLHHDYIALKKIRRCTALAKLASSWLTPT